MRYIIKYGRFGAYIYDTKTKEDIDLFKTIELLNNQNQLNVSGVYIQDTDETEVLK